MIRLLLLVALWAVLPASPTWAHAALVRSEPADGAVLAAAPERILLEFNEPVSPIALRLVGVDGEPIDLTEFHVADATVAVVPPTGLSAGSHILSWRVTSADGHPIGGSLVFSIGAPSPAPTAVPAFDQPRALVILVARLAIYVALFFGVGGGVFVAWAARGQGVPAAAIRTMLGLSAAGLAVLPVALLLQGLDLLDAGFPSAASAAPWRAALATSYAVTLAIAALSLCLGIAALLAPCLGVSRALSAAALAAAGVALAASGHASAAEPQVLMRPAVFLHVVGAAFWVGSLLPLGAMLGTRSPEAHAALRRFSAAILYSVIGLTAAGLVLAIVQVEHIAALWTTAYGLVFDAKMLAVAALLALAAFNRYRLTGPVLHNDRGASATLARSIAVELALAFAILGIVALWRYTPPPRALYAAEAAMRPAVVQIHTGTAMAEVRIMPGRVGPARATVYLTDHDGRPLAPKAVTLVFRRHEAGLEPIVRPLADAGHGLWTMDGLVLPLAGQWAVEVEVFLTDFDRADLDGTIDIRP